MTFSGTATDDENLANVEIRFRNTTTRRGAGLRRHLGDRATRRLVPRSPPPT